MVKVKTWKTEMEKKGLRVNMGKTKIMESGINLDVLKKSGKYPCGVCLTGVGRTNAIQCDGCKCWVHKKCSGIKGRLLRESEFRCAQCLGTARAIDGRHSLEVEYYIVILRWPVGSRMLHQNTTVIRRVTTVRTERGVRLTVCQGDVS